MAVEVSVAERVAGEDRLAAGRPVRGAVADFQYRREVYRRRRLQHRLRHGLENALWIAGSGALLSMALAGILGLR
jgi:hypothetical protein